MSEKYGVKSNKYIENKEYFNDSKVVKMVLPHLVFQEFSNQQKDGELVHLIFVDQGTGDIYTPDGQVRMKFYSGD